MQILFGFKMELFYEVKILMYYSFSHGQFESLCFYPNESF